LLNRFPGGTMRDQHAGSRMTSISTSAVPAGVRAAPIAAARNAAYDRARTFIILLVLLHHSIIPYTYYGHTDRQSFMGFDAMVIFNDSYFMSAMFFLSGLFVWPSLQRKGTGCFLRDRWWRLGVPFAVAAVILMPIAYYAIEIRQHDTTFAAYWWKTITVGPWPSGPAWFIWVLLAFDVLAVVVFRSAPGCVEAIGRLSLASLKRPAFSFWALLIGSIIVYVPAEVHFDASRWFTLGPLAIQASRVLLYLLYFFAGVGIGSVRCEVGLLSGDGELARRWPVWLAASIAGYGCIIALFYVRHSLMPKADVPPMWWNSAYALTFAFFCAAQTFALLALFLRFDSDGWSILDPLRESSYGIYLIHYVPMLWLQYALFNISLTPVSQVTAIVKAVIVSSGTLALSWAATVAVRRIPAVAEVL
jgi:surface polysaccharide O-acyltransferase-like enzyme